MAGQKFARLIRAQNTTPEGLAAAIAAGSERAERSLARHRVR